MVSLWPWKGDDNSPASFERSLASLAAKISKSQAQLDTLRQRGRRFTALWTLYTSFAYLLCSIIMFLVVGWKNWGTVEYTAIAGSPLLQVIPSYLQVFPLLSFYSIYAVRTALTTYYTFRVDSITQRLEDQQAERAKTIDKLKAATKYNSTQELLERYGGTASAALKPKSQATPSKSPKTTKNQPPRTSLNQPPATANIPRPIQIPSQSSTPQAAVPQLPQGRGPAQPSVGFLAHSQSQPGPPEFAPNAFTAPPQYAQAGELNPGGHWYDRMLDLLLGEDEMSPKNRMALICQNCRLVNGQAPPGAKTLADVGKWRCFGCGTMNGEEDEGVKAVKEMKELIETNAQSVPVEGAQNKSLSNAAKADSADAEGNEGVDTSDMDVESDSSEEVIEVKPKRGRPKGNKKKA